MTTERIVHAAEVYFMMKQTQNLNKNCHESYLQEFTTSSSDIETGEQSIGEVPILYNSPISNSVKEIEEIREECFCEPEDNKSQITGGFGEDKSIIENLKYYMKDPESESFYALLPASIRKTFPLDSTLMLKDS